MKTKINKSAKRVISAVVAVALLVGTLFTANVGVSINAEAADATSVWSGSAASDFAGGNGSKTNPYIIRTAEQLYKMANTSSNNGVYYKVADGVDAIYLNNVTGATGAERLASIKSLVSAKTAKNWRPDGTFAGIFDGNGVTIYGLYTRGTWNCAGFMYELNDGAVIKNVTFDAAYALNENSETAKPGNSHIAVITTRTRGNNTISNVAVVNSRVEATMADIPGGTATAGGIVATGIDPKKLTLNNCFFDGASSELVANGKINDYTNTSVAGIASMDTSMNCITFNGCISIGVPVVSMVPSVSYDRYQSANKRQVKISNCYSPITEGFNLITNDIIGGGVTSIGDDTTFTKENMPLLDWANGWHIATVEGHTIPMPTATAGSDTATDYTDALIKQLEGAAANSGNGMSSQYGKYGWHTLLSGSGTKDDPYIITNALELARAIGSGGVYLTQKLYYKLGCDIDLGGAKWLNGTTNDASYKYVPFEGTLDGDGHAITGLYAADKDATGLIPTLNGGEVKNLHIVNSYAGSKVNAGLIVGSVSDGATGTIKGCAIDSSSTNSSSTSGNIFAGTDAVKVTNSYAVVDGNATYYGKTANTVTAAPTSDLYDGTNADTAKWYGMSGAYRDIKFAKANTIADVDGDGSVTDYYKVSDLQALRNNLLGKSDYANIYGDVNNDGETDLRDLAVIRREMVGDDTFVKDGFWRNVEVGKTKIYYAENDTYDMARRMELYLESLYPSLDVTKVAGTAVTAANVGTLENYNNEDNAIVIVKDTKLTYDKYSIDYNATKNVLTVTGGSFTAVEYAVNEFIINCNPANGRDVYTNTADTATILNDTAITSKATGTANVSADGKESFLGSKTVGGQTYYYAWGDEFEEGTTYSANNWNYLAYRSQSVNTTDSSSANAGNELYFGMEVATVDSLNDLWVVDTDGKLSIKRGYNSNIVTGTDATNAANNGYVSVSLGVGGATHPDYEKITINSVDKYVDAGQIATNKSMLFKQGYAEMRASLPSDGHAFPAWWFLTGTTQTQNTQFARNLYSKVYKLNEKWDGTNDMDPAKLATYKYQTPKAYLEFDIVEFMQNQDGIVNGSLGKKTGVATGNYIDHLNLTVHKIYNQGVKDGVLYIPNWSTYSVGTVIDRDKFVNTSTSSTDFIHKYNYINTTTKYPYTDENAGKSTFSIGKAVTDGNIQDTYTYGFAWNVDETAETYSIKVYVDLNNDGVMSDSNELVLEVNQDTGHDTAFDNNGTSVDIQNGKKCTKDPTIGTDDEYSIWNQYAYMLLDNCFYTSNAYGSATFNLGSFKYDAEVGITPFTDVLSQESGDKTTFDVEYVRVYQQDGARDIVTPATEAFNTGNHFGY